MLTRRTWEGEGDQIMPILYLNYYFFYFLGSLLANMILSVLVLKRSYTWQKYLSVGMISVGITICTLMSARPSNSAQVEFTYEEYMKWLWGIFLLVAGLLMAARLGIYQEQLASKYGKHPQEMLFYSVSYLTA